MRRKRKKLERKGRKPAHKNFQDWNREHHWGPKNRMERSNVRKEKKNIEKVMRNKNPLRPKPPRTRACPQKQLARELRWRRGDAGGALTVLLKKPARTRVGERYRRGAVRYQGKK